MYISLKQKTIFAVTSFPLSIHKERPRPLSDVAEDDWSGEGPRPHPPMENQIYYLATGDRLTAVASQELLRICIE